MTDGFGVDGRYMVKKIKNKISKGEARYALVNNTLFDKSVE